MRRIIIRLIALITLAAACWLLAIPLWGSQRFFQEPSRLFTLVIAAFIFAAILALVVRISSASLWIISGLFLLIGLLWPASTILKVFPPSGAEPFGSAEALSLFSIPTIALIVAALLFYSAQELYKQWQVARMEAAGNLSASRRLAFQWVVALLLGVFLLARSLYNIYWLLVWDNTTDPLGYAWVVFPVMAAVFSGVVWSYLYTGPARWWGLGYALFVTFLLITVSARARQVDFRQLTENRAEQVSRAIETYFARNGRYPSDLRVLSPWYVTLLPGPVIIFGQDWCYDTGDGYYRLGYVYRAHWSDPRLVGKIYRSRGDIPALPLMCERKIVALQASYPEYPYSYWKEEGE